MKVKITYNTDPRTIEEFAELHDLTMEVRERPVALQKHGRFTASFEKSEIKDGGLLIGLYGNGNTPEEAIAGYGKQISGKLLVINAYGDPVKRKEILVPEFVYE